MRSDRSASSRPGRWTPSATSCASTCRSLGVDAAARCAATRRRSSGCSPRSASAPAALAVIGGTVGVIAFLSFFTGTEVGLQGYSALDQLGTGAFTGFISAYFNTREIAPLVAGLALARDGRLRLHRPARRDADQRGGRRARGDGRAVSLPFLVTTRMIAGFVAVIPLYVIGLLSSYFATRIIVTAYFGQSTGTYDHYFHLFLPPGDVLWSFVKVLVFAVVIILIHCYYGYTATGGPAGVGVAVGTRGAHLDRRHQRRRLLPQPRDLGRHHDRPDRRVARRSCRHGVAPRAPATEASARGFASAASYGVAFLLVAGAAARAVRSRRSRSAFTPVVHGHAADRPHRQPAAGGRRTSRCAASSSARSARSSTRRRGRARAGAAAGQGRADPGQRHRTAAAQDAVRRAVRRPRDARPAVAGHRCAPATSSPQDRTVGRHRARDRSSTTCCRCCARCSRPSWTTTLNALSTALRRPGRAARAQPRARRPATSRSSTRTCRRCRQDISGLVADVADALRRRPRRTCSAGARPSGSPTRPSSRRPAPRRPSSSARPGSPTTPRRCPARERAAHHPGRPGRARRRWTLLAAVLAHLPLRRATGLASWLPRIDAGVRRRHPAHHPGGRAAPPAVLGRARSRAGSTNRAPDCYGLPAPGGSQAHPYAGDHFDDGTAREHRPPVARCRRRCSAASAVGLRRAPAPPQEQRVVGALLAPTATPPTERHAGHPATCSLGPMLRGTVVRHAMKVKRLTSSSSSSSRWSRSSRRASSR